MTEGRLSAELLALLGEAGLIALSESHGGTRYYVPNDPARIDFLPFGSAQRLARRFGGGAIRAPLARHLRARHYRAQGQSNAQIARALGLTETGVDRLFSKMDGLPAKGDARQPSLFS